MPTGPTLLTRGACADAVLSTRTAAGLSARALVGGLVDAFPRSWRNKVRFNLLEHCRTPAAAWLLADSMLGATQIPIPFGGWSVVSCNEGLLEGGLLGPLLYCLSRTEIICPVISKQLGVPVPGVSLALPGDKVPALAHCDDLACLGNESSRFQAGPCRLTRSSCVVVSGWRGVRLGQVVLQAVHASDESKSATIRFRPDLLRRLDSDLQLQRQPIPSTRVKVYLGFLFDEALKMLPNRAKRIGAGWAAGKKLIPHVRSGVIAWHAFVDRLESDVLPARGRSSSHARTAGKQRWVRSGSGSWAWPSACRHGAPMR